ncbi:MAG: hypothetical protein R3D01_10160 [Hyphomicrobiales bacterium]
MHSERQQYKGYDIQLRREWSNWCASVHPTRADLPILTQSPLHTLARRKDQALAAAKRSIDGALAELVDHAA